MIPTRRMVLILWLWFGLSLTVVVWPQLLVAWLSVGMGAFGFIMADFWRAYRLAAPTLERHVPQALGVQQTQLVTLHLQGLSAIMQRLRCYEHLPASFLPHDMPAALYTRGAVSLSINYGITPTQRGHFCLSATDIWCSTRLGLWWRAHRQATTTCLTVYPRMPVMVGAATVAYINGDAGSSIGPQSGIGSEFWELCDYQPGEPSRHLDWKASAKRGILTSRRYQQEQRRGVVFILDCGQGMGAGSGLHTLFDDALTAVLAVTKLLIRQGEAVGFATVGGPQIKLAARTGQQRFTELMASIHALQPTLEVADIEAGLAWASMNRPQPAKVIVVTHAGGAINLSLDSFLAARRRLRIALVGVQDSNLTAALNQTPNSFFSALRLAAAHHYRNDELQCIREIRRRGVLWAEGSGEALPHLLLRVQRRL